MQKTQIAIMAVLLLAGACAPRPAPITAPKPEMEWSAAGKTKAQALRDEKQCQFKADSATATLFDLNAKLMMLIQLSHECMEAKGYHMQVATSGR